jgi:hypothetical protein
MTRRPRIPAALHWKTKRLKCHLRNLGVLRAFLLACGLVLIGIAVYFFILMGSLVGWGDVDIVTWILEVMTVVVALCLILAALFFPDE